MAETRSSGLLGSYPRLSQYLSEGFAGTGSWLDRLLMEAGGRGTGALSVDSMARSMGGAGIGAIPGMPDADDSYTLPQAAATRETTPTTSPRVTPAPASGPGFWERAWDSTFGDKQTGDVLTRLGLEFARGTRGGFTGTLQNLADAGIAAQGHAGDLRREELAKRQVANAERAVGVQEAQLKIAVAKVHAEAAKQNMAVRKESIDAAIKAMGLENQFQAMTEEAMQALTPSIIRVAQQLEEFTVTGDAPAAARPTRKAADLLKGK